MTSKAGSGRRGASLAEALVATVLLAVGVLVWAGAFNRSVRLLDEAHLGLHAAILLTEASRSSPAATPAPRPAGPGRVVVVPGAVPPRVRYEPPPGPGRAGARAYAAPRVWTLEP